MMHDNWIYNSHCSALIKVTGNLDEIYAGHTSWFVYAAMLRIAKDYNFPLHNPTTASKRYIVHVFLRAVLNALSQGGIQFISWVLGILG